MSAVAHPWPRVLRRAVVRAVVVGAALALLGAVFADGDDAVFALLCGGVAAIMTILERAPLPAALDTAARRALVAWPLAALWVLGAAVQVAYVMALTEGRGPEQAWSHAWSFVASVSDAPLVVVVLHLLVTSWVPDVVRARLLAPSLGAQLRRAALPTFGIAAGLCGALIVLVESSSPAAGVLMAVALAGVLAATAASAALVVLRVLDALPILRPEPHPDGPGPTGAC